MENNYIGRDGFEAYDEVDFSENALTQNLVKPMLEPGNMMGHSNFEDYYRAMVIKPQIHAKETEFQVLLDELKKFYRNGILACTDLYDVESFHSYTLEATKLLRYNLRIAEKGFRAGQRILNK